MRDLWELKHEYQYPQREHTQNLSPQQKIVKTFQGEKREFGEGESSDDASIEIRGPRPANSYQPKLPWPKLEDLDFTKSRPGIDSTLTKNENRENWRKYNEIGSVMSNPFTVQVLKASKGSTDSKVILSQYQDAQQGLLSKDLLVGKTEEELYIKSCLLHSISKLRANVNKALDESLTSLDCRSSKQTGERDAVTSIWDYLDTKTQTMFSNHKLPMRGVKPKKKIDQGIENLQLSAQVREEDPRK